MIRIATEPIKRGGDESAKKRRGDLPRRSIWRHVYRSALFHLGERLFVVGVHLFAYAVPRAVHFLMAELLHAGKPFFVLQDPADLVRPGLDAVVGKVAVSVRRNDLRSGAAAREQAGGA